MEEEDEDDRERFRLWQLAASDASDFCSDDSVHVRHGHAFVNGAIWLGRRQHDPGLRLVYCGSQAYNGNHEKEAGKAARKTGDLCRADAGKMEESVQTGSGHCYCSRDFNPQTRIGSVLLHRSGGFSGVRNLVLFWYY